MLKHKEYRQLGSTFDENVIIDEDVAHNQNRMVEMEQCYWSVIPQDDIYKSERQVLKNDCKTDNVYESECWPFKVQYIQKMNFT